MDWKKRLKLSTIQTRSMNTVEKMDIFPIGFVESFIENLLAKRENEIAEEVKKAYQKKSSQLHGGYDDSDYLNAYGMAIHDVLQIIKH